MVTCDDTRCRIEGEITIASAASILAELKPRIAEKIPLLDLSGVAHVDSTALALILSCMREAEQQNYLLVFSGFPASVTTLADLYGIAPLLHT